MMETDRREQDDVDDTKSDASSEISISRDSQIPIMEEKEHLQVYLRIRPFTSAENTNGESQDCVTMETPDTVLLKPPSLSLSARLSSDKSLPQTGQRFQFSQVYGPETSQKDLFTGTVKDLVKDVLTGGNSLVFTYGVTNAGKTFTFLGPDGDAGILPRSLDLIFSSLEEHVFTEINIKPQRCREFTRLSSEQQSEEAAFKRGLFRQLKESERGNASMLNATNKTFLEGTFMCGSTASDRVTLDLDPHTKFSVWVSFCEIYNENIHDLLESVQSGAVRRTALRLSQDVKGNAFVKDLRWVQVNSAEEAYKVMKLGKTNQSFSSTRLNQLSSRSHSMFSIRILRIDDIGSPRVHTVSELCLCDLAGSERCAKTQNKGDRLKEAGNINTSLLILGKCINALRHNQQAKLLQHVPFRESKLTHYLQGFFCGRGRACMIVNINQCASMYDETLNVLKFSAVAQRVVVLTTRPVPIIPKRSASEISVAMSNAERKNRRSSLIGWDTSLEDVQEGDDDEEQSLMDDTMDQTTNEEDGDGDETITIGKKTHQRQVALVQQLQLCLKQEQASGLLAEARVRDEISREFSELFSEMQNDYNDRLSREREILEERAERRLEIFKKLIDKMAAPGQDAHLMDVSLDSDLSDFKKAAEVLEQNEHQRKLQEQMAQKRHGESIEEENEEKSRLQFQLQEKCVQVARLEKQVAILQKGAELKTGAELDSQRQQSSQEREGLEDALASLETERKGREEVLAALEYQTMGKEDALKSLEEEREAREVAIVKINELKHSNAELLASLEEQTRRNAQATVAVAAVTAATRERLSREERVKEQNEIDSLRQEFKELTDKLEATERQVNSETERAEKAFLQLQTAQEQLEQHYKENQEKTSQISTLTQEVQNLKEDGRNAATSSSDITDRLREKLSEHRKDLFEEKEKNKSKDQEMLQMEQKLTQANEKLAQLTKNFNLQESASKLKDIELRKVEENSQRQLDEVRAKLEGKELEQQELRAKLEEQAQASEKQVRHFDEKLQAQELASRQHLDELKQQLNEQKATSDQLLMDLKANIGELERNAADEATSKSAKSSEEEHLKRLNSGLQAEVESLKDKVAKLDEISKIKALEVEKRLEQQLASAEMAEMLKEKDTQLAEKLAGLEKKLQEKELEVKSLQKSLKDSEELSNMEEINKTEAKLASSELEKMLKEKDTQLAEKLAEFEKTLLERESEVKSLQKSLKQAEDRREEESVVLKEKISKMEEKRQTEAKLASTEMDRMLKEKDKLLAGKLIHLEKMLHEKESEVKSVQKSLKQAEDRLAETKVRKERKSEMQKICQSEARLASLQLDKMIKEKDIQLAEKLADLEKKLIEKELEVNSLLKSLKDSEELSNMEEKRQTEAKLASAEMEKMLKEKDTQLAEKLADLEKTLLEKESEVKSLQNSLKQASECHEEDIRQTESKLASAEIDTMLKEKDTQLAEKLADLEKKLHEKESEVKSLQKSLKQASERREEEESVAVQEARRREVERRRELLAVAHEAIAQKDEDLEKKAQEINRLKENGRLDSDKVKSLSLDLQRKDEDASDLREKLADYKKQIQQVQKEISTMREEENSLKQKLSDTEKVKKQLQNDVANRDRMIHQLKVDQCSNTKSDQTLYEKACKDLESKEAIMEDMRLALTEQEETQEQMETILEEKLTTIEELSTEVDKLKGLLLHQDRGRNTVLEGDSSSDDVKLAKQETAQAQEKLKLCTDKHQTDRRKWLEEKLSLIGQAKEAEDKRNQEMRKFAEDRERYNRQQGQLESLSSQLSEKDQTLDTWRQERDTLVKALEVQLMKLLSSQSEKDKLIQQLQQQNTHSPPENGDGGVGVAELQAALSERETEIQRLKDQLQVFKSKQEETDTQTLSPEAPASSEGNPDSDTITRKSGGRRRDTRASVTSQSSTGYPSVLESSEISTENGRMRRFPKPEMEISFSPLKPNHMALRRHGDHSSVTVKITRSARKRKSEEMGQEEIEAENRRNTKTRLTPKLTPHKEELSLTTGRHDSQSSIRSKKDGALQKIGDFLHSSPTMLGSKAKKMMGLMSGRSDLESASSSSSLSLRAKKSNRKLYRPEISTPMDMPSHPIINRDPEEKDSDHQLIKRRLRTRMAK